MGVFEGTDVLVQVHISGAPQGSDELSIWSERPLPATQQARCNDHCRQGTPPLPAPHCPCSATCTSCFSHLLVARLAASIRCNDH